MKTSSVLGYRWIYLTKILRGAVAAIMVATRSHQRKGSAEEEAVSDRDAKVQILSDEGHAAKRQRMQKKLKKYKDAYDRRGMR